MSTQPVVIEKVFKTSPEKVWQALTDREQMKKWYFDPDDFRAETGFEFRFSGQGHKGEQYIHLCKVLEVIPRRKLQYSWQYENLEGYSVVTFELFEEGDQTRLRLTHEGLESFPQDNPDFSVTSFTGGWTEIVTRSLAGYLATLS